jgi:hypothetical protein
MKALFGCETVVRLSIVAYFVGCSVFAVGTAAFFLAVIGLTP